MRIGFIGLGNVGGKLAGSLLRNGYDLVVRDLDPGAAQPFLDGGAGWADSPRQMAEACDVVVTCLPSPAACSAVMEEDDGILAGLGSGKVWMEMSTTDESEVRRLGALSPWTVRFRAAATAPPPATSPSSRAAAGRPSNGCCRCSRPWGAASCTRARWGRHRS